jgi:hypothetical protein
VLLTAAPGWTENIVRRPGSNLIVLAHAQPDRVGIEGRMAGLHLRDTLIVLRPRAVSYAFLFRLPFEGTVTGTFLREGTVALDIAGTRVGWKSEAERLSALPGSMPKANASVGTFQTRDRSRERPEDFQSALGRWPSNVVLIHASACRRVGEKKVPAASGVSKDAPITAVRRSGAHASAGGHQAIGRVQPVFGYGGDDGLETVAAYECEPDCPVVCLDAQSGLL